MREKNGNMGLCGTRLLNAGRSLPSLQRVLVVSCLPFCVPFLLYVAAGRCGREGVLLGRVFCSGIPLSLVALAAYFVVRTALSFRQSQVLALVNCLAVLLCVVALIWSYHRTPFLDAFESSLRRAHSASEIQSWAVEILGAVKENKVIKRSEYPKWATDNRFPRPDGIYVVNDEAAWEEGYVKISWGSGVVGQWGLIVGPSTLTKRGRTWSPGVYFFVSPRPYGWRE